MKRIVLLKSNAGAIGGLELYTRKLAEAFAKVGHEVTLLTTGPVLEFPCAALSLCETTKFSLQHITRFDAKAQKWIRKHKPDIIFGMERNSFQTHYRAGSGVHAAYLKRRAQRESLLKRLSFAVNPLHRTILSLERKAFEDTRLQRLFVNSQMVKAEILDHYKIEPGKLSVVHNGVDWQGAEATEASEQFHFLFVGNDFRRKGLRCLLKSLAGLRDYRLTVVGSDKNASEYMKLAQELNINADFAGPQSDLKSFYREADCLVLPTLYDPFANVTLEALAHGLFVVTSTMNGGKEVLTPYSGLITERRDLQEALFKAIHFKRNPKKIRNSVKMLTFENQLKEIVDQC